MLYWINDLRKKPILQAALCLAIAFFLQLSYFIIYKLQHKDIEVIDIWAICPTLLLFYILLNIVFGFKNENINNYYRNSIYGFVGFLALDIIFCQFLTGQGVSEVKSIKWIIFVFGIVYLVFLSILNLIRFILQLVLKQDRQIQEEAKNKK
ncbi:MAG: hypothetical protein ABI851_03775 [Saprospiraceae bacterium]